MIIPLRILPHAQDLSVPRYATELSAGLDVLAAVAQPVTLNPGQRALIPTGLSWALPEGMEAQIRSRSGLALKHGVVVLNAPGTIDADYRGEVGIILMNLGQALFVVERGLRVAQVVFARVEKVEWQLVDSLPSTQRSEGGFGSTGL